MISERLHVRLELYVDATNVISQPLIDEVHEALSIRAVEATHHVALPEPRQGFNKLWMRLSVLLSCRAMTSFHDLSSKPKWKWATLPSDSKSNS